MGRRLEGNGLEVGRREMEVEVEMEMEEVMSSDWWVEHTYPW